MEISEPFKFSQLPENYFRVLVLIQYIVLKKDIKNLCIIQCQFALNIQIILQTLTLVLNNKYVKSVFSLTFLLSKGVKKIFSVLIYVNA